MTNKKITKYRLRKFYIGKRQFCSQNPCAQTLIKHSGWVLWWLFVWLFVMHFVMHFVMSWRGICLWTKAQGTGLAKACAQNRVRSKGFGSGAWRAATGLAPARLRGLDPACGRGGRAPKRPLWQPQFGPAPSVESEPGGWSSPRWSSPRSHRPEQSKKIWTLKPNLNSPTHHVGVIWNSESQILSDPTSLWKRTLEL